MKNFLLIIIGFLMLGSSAIGQKSRSDQVKMLGSDLFMEKGLTGKGIKIAILDAGFPGVDTQDAFEHLRKNKQIVKTWDFIRNDPNVYRGNPHGTAVLSCMAGIINGEEIGLATGAEYLLARTEMLGEPKREEILFEKGVDWAIENGAMIIQTSLGYTYQRYFKEEMDGNHSIAAKAIKKAVDHGLLVIVSMGNEGLTKWHILDTPADVDGIISVGALDPETYLASQFSSFGPTSDGRIKPELVALGTAWTATGKTIKTQSGTSFAAPLIAGFAACAWQAFPDISAQKLRDRLIRSGNLYPYYDYSLGFGFPHARRFIYPDNEVKPTMDPQSLNEGFNVDILSRMGKNNYPFAYDYIYYHVENPDGKLSTYGVVRIDRLGKTRLPLKTVESGSTVRVFFGGYVIQKKF